MNKKIVTIAAAGIVALGGVGYVFGVGGEEGSHSVTPAEGGEWEYGASAGRTWSNFLHDDEHAASVQGHEFVDSGCVKGGEWARATAPSRWIKVIDNEQNQRLC